MKTVVEEINRYDYRNDLNDHLMNEFQEVLQKNSAFENMVNQLKMSYEELSKYTSLLEESSEEYDHCKKCNGLFECQNKISGYAYLPMKRKKKLTFGYQACKYQNKYLKEKKYQENVYSFQEPKEIKNASMKEIYIDDEKRFELIKWMKHFIKKYQTTKEGKGLYLYGSFGSGKTYLLSAMFNELAKKGIKSAIVFWPEYLANLKGYFKTGEYIDQIDYLKKVPLLLIDDIGAENSTSWSRDEVLSPILQYRMQEGLTTFFTSNLDKKSLEEHLSISKDGIEGIKARRILERINQLTEEMSLMSKNLRK